MATFPRIRNLTTDDLQQAKGLSDLAAWNQTESDWRLLLDLAPKGCLCIELDGRVAATATLLCYGTRLAWVGMVLTHPDYRGKGFASKLFASVVERAGKIGVRTVKLDATEQGQSLYTRFGFTVEQPVERWLREGTDGSGEGMRESEEVDNHVELDTEAFGADRSRLLTSLQRHGHYFSSRGSSLFTRAGRNTTHIGPCVAREQESAYELLDSAIRHTNARAWSWDLLPRNQKAVALAADLGFAPARRLVRMSHGPELRGREEFVYATAGFELG